MIVALWLWLLTEVGNTEQEEALSRQEILEVANAYDAWSDPFPSVRSDVQKWASEYGGFVPRGDVWPPFISPDCSWLFEKDGEIREYGMDEFGRELFGYSQVLLGDVTVALMPPKIAQAKDGYRVELGRLWIAYEHYGRVGTVATIVVESTLDVKQTSSPHGQGRGGDKRWQIVRIIRNQRAPSLGETARAIEVLRGRPHSAGLESQPPFFGTWVSPNGEWIYFPRGVNSEVGSHIARVGAEGGEVTSVTAPGDWYEFGVAGGLSGSLLVYSTRWMRFGEVLMLPEGAKEASALSCGSHCAEGCIIPGYFAEYPATANDARDSLACITCLGRDQAIVLFEAGVAGRCETKLLSALGGRCKTPVFGLDGRVYFVWESIRASRNVFSIEVASRDGKIGSLGPKMSGHASILGWTSDKRLMVQVLGDEVNGANTALRLINPKGGDPVSFDLDEVMALPGGRVSPDGRHLALVSRETYGLELILVDLVSGDGDPRWIASSSTYLGGICWAPSSSWLTFIMVDDHDGVSKLECATIEGQVRVVAKTDLRIPSNLRAE